MGSGSVRAEDAAGRDAHVARAPAHLEEAAAGAHPDAVRRPGYPEGRAVCVETGVRLRGAGAMTIQQVARSLGPKVPIDYRGLR
jgi:hypothetical protein